MRLANCLSEMAGSGLMKTLTTRAPSLCLARTALRKREDPILCVVIVSSHMPRCARTRRSKGCYDLS